MTRRAVFASLLGLGAISCVGEGASAVSQKAKRQKTTAKGTGGKGNTVTAKVPYRGLSPVGSDAPPLVYLRSDYSGNRYVSWERKNDGSISRPEIVVFAGTLTEAEKAKASTWINTMHLVARSHGDGHLVWLESIAGGAKFGLGWRQCGREVDVKPGDTADSDGITYTFNSSAKYSELWGIRPEQRFALFLVGGQGKILFRHDGFKSLDINELLAAATKAHCYRNGVPGTASTCSQCQGAGRWSVRCDICNGAGKVDCTRCSNGYTVSSSGSLWQCYSCRGSGHITCEQCRDRVTPYVAQGVNPDGLGKVRVECIPCDGTGMRWIPK